MPSTEEKNVHAGHRQRVKTRAISEGFDHFAPHEVLELLLFMVVPYKDTNKLSHQLIDKFGSFSAVLNANIDELNQFPLLKDNASMTLSLFKSLFRYYKMDKLKSFIKLSNQKQLLEYAFVLLEESEYEELVVLLLDSDCKVIKNIRKRQQSPNTFGLSIREIVYSVLRSNATYCVLMHSHPNGDVYPSSSDDIFTKELFSTLSKLDVAMLDHIIVSADKHYSYNESMRISGFRDIVICKE